MNSLGVIYWAEIRKIMSKKSAWIAMIIGFAFVALVGLTNLSADGKSAYVKKQEAKLINLSGQKMDQSFFDAFQKEIDEEFQNNWSSYEKVSSYDLGIATMNAATAIGEKALYDNILNVMRSRDNIYGVTEKEFYEKMRQNIIDDGYEAGASQDDIDAWMKSFDSVEKPIVYSYALSYSNIIDILFIVSWVLIICISVALSGVFADEKVSRMDALILSSRRGRIPIYVIKILASMTVAIVQAIILFGGGIGLMFSAYGTAGWKASIQNIIPSSAWNITIGKMIMIYAGLAILSSIFFAMTNIVISNLTGSSVATMAIHASSIFVGLFNIPRKLGEISKWWELRPTMSLYYGTFCNTHMYGKLNNIQASVLLYGVCIIAMVAILIFRASSCRRQLSRRR